MWKLSTKWVLIWVNADQKLQQCQSSEQLLVFLWRNPIVFLLWFLVTKVITMTRRQSNSQWSGGITAHPTPKYSECKNPLQKFLPRFFWDQDSILLINYLPKGQTINMEYYLYPSLLVQLKDVLKEKRCGKFTNEVLFLHDNALGH
jgi:hypothetical protein